MGLGLRSACENRTRRVERGGDGDEAYRAQGADFKAVAQKRLPHATETLSYLIDSDWVDAPALSESRQIQWAVCALVWGRSTL